MSHDAHNGDAMRKNGNGTVERRLAFLERVYLEDRERWAHVAAESRNNEGYFRSILAILGRQSESLRRQGDKLEVLTGRMEAALKVMYRRMEHR